MTRDKVMCVCQALLECNVFEAVGTKVFGKNKKRDVFQDSKSALYRFETMNTQTPSFKSDNPAIMEGECAVTVHLH